MSINLQGSTNAPSKYKDQALSNVPVTACAQTCEMTGWKLYNPNSADAFVKFCDTNTSGTTVVGTTAVVYTLLVPGLSEVVLEHNKGSAQHYFTTGCVLYAVTGYLDSNTTAPTTGLAVQIYFKPS